MSEFMFGQNPTEAKAADVVSLLNSGTLTRDEFESIQAAESQGKNRASIMKVEYVPPLSETFNLDNLEVQSVGSMPKIKRGRAVKENPFVAHLEASYAAGDARSLVVSLDQVGALTNQIRNAADRIGCGARIVYEVNGESVTAKELDELDGGEIRVWFAGVDRRQRSANSTDETGDDTADEYHGE